MSNTTRTSHIWWFGLFSAVLVCFLSGCVSTDLVKQMITDIDTLKAENKNLRDEITELRGQVEELETDRGIESEVEEGGSEPVEMSAGFADEMAELVSGESESGTDVKPAASRPSSVSGEELYTRAQSLYTGQRYREAVQVFSQAKLLGDSPEFLARCDYWIGECMYAQGAYERALESFANVFVKYGNTSKASDALLKIGFTYCELRNYNGARQALNEFIQRFPDHRAVPFAEERLRWMDNLESGEVSGKR